MSFNYDEVIQLRVAVSEAFSLAVRCSNLEMAGPSAQEMALRFVVENDRIEILIPALVDYTGPLDSQEEIESQALLGSLMDELEYGSGDMDQPIVRMVKYNTVHED